jgi:hypothetical protein
MLLRLYPTSYRGVFGREMLLVFQQAAGDHQPRGFLPYAAFLCAEFSCLIAGAFSMWTDEYLLRSRRQNATFALCLIAGAAVTALCQGCLYARPGGGLRVHTTVATPSAPPDPTLPLVLAGGTLIFISVFSMAFVWNMRTVGNRAGRLKPIWMPGRAHARTARRDETLHRNSGRQRRELHRRIR